MSYHSPGWVMLHLHCGKHGKPDKNMGKWMVTKIKSKHWKEGSAHKHYNHEYFIRITTKSNSINCMNRAQCVLTWGCQWYIINTNVFGPSISITNYQMLWLHLVPLQPMIWAWCLHDQQGELTCYSSICFAPGWFIAIQCLHGSVRLQWINYGCLCFHRF